MGQVNAIAEEIEGRFPAAPERVQFQEALRALIDWLVSGLVTGTIEAAEESERRRFRRGSRAASPAGVFTAATQATNRELKQYLHHAVYFTGPMVEERRRSASMIGELFRILPQRSRRSCPKATWNRLAESPLHRVVCDYIAGMTDGFFLRTYKQFIRA